MVCGGTMGIASAVCPNEIRIQTLQVESPKKIETTTEDRQGTTDFEDVDVKILSLQLSLV